MRSALLSHKQAVLYDTPNPAWVIRHCLLSFLLLLIFEVFVRRTQCAHATQTAAQPDCSAVHSQQVKQTIIKIRSHPSPWCLDEKVQRKILSLD